MWIISAGRVVRSLVRWQIELISRSGSGQGEPDLRSGCSGEHGADLGLRSSRRTKSVWRIRTAQPHRVRRPPRLSFHCLDKVMWRAGVPTHTNIRSDIRGMGSECAGRAALLASHRVHAAYSGTLVEARVVCGRPRSGRSTLVGGRPGFWPGLTSPAMGFALAVRRSLPRCSS